MSGKPVENIGHLRKTWEIYGKSMENMGHLWNT